MAKKKTSMTLNDKILEVLDEMADANDRSRSGMMRQLIREARERAEAARTTKETEEAHEDGNEIPKDD